MSRREGKSGEVRGRSRRKRGREGEVSVPDAEAVAGELSGADAAETDAAEAPVGGPSPPAADPPSPDRLGDPPTVSAEVEAAALVSTESAPSDRWPRDLQGLVARLLEFWLAKGCALLPPLDFPVPAATLHPDVFFHLLGNGPPNTVFLQPVRRPMDCREGLHPFRFSRPLQLEVVWSGPGQELQPMFVESLRAVGLELGAHDLRFADGIYESLTLTARGMSWHADVDGLGVARISFLHRALGRNLDPPVCELVYGLERLAMVLLGHDRADDIPWRWGGETRGGLFGGLEKEYSYYLTKIADLEAWKVRLEQFENEAQRCLENGLLGTSYELAVRCLEGIDLLTLRGELSPYARDERLGRIRDLVLAVAGAASEAPQSGSEPDA